MRRLIPLAAAIALLFPASRSVSSQVQADDANVLSDAIMTYMTGYTNSWMSGENTDALGKYVPPEDSGGSPPQPPAPLPPETVPKEDIIDVKGDSTTPDPTKPQDEVVIPVSGDSSSPVDEVMDGGSYALLRPAAFYSGVAPVVSTAAIASGFKDGVLTLRVVSARPLSAAERRTLFASQFAVTPVSAARKKGIERWLAATAPRGSGVHVTSMAFRAFCLQSLKRPPVPDTVFVIAPRALQEQYRPMRSVTAAAQFAAAHGYLRPQGDAAEYGRFVTQYAVWTKLEHWDQARFTKELIDRTRKQAMAAKKPWTAETEQTLRVLAPARWRDIQLVIRAAGIVETKHRTSGGTQ